MAGGATVRRWPSPDVGVLASRWSVLAVRRERLRRRRPRVRAPTAPLARDLPATHGGTLRLVTAGSRIALDPAFASDPASQRVAFVTCETLLTYADEPGEGGRT